MVEIRFAAKVTELVLYHGVKYIDAIDEVFPDERKIFQSSNLSVQLAKLSIKHFYLYENILNEYKVELNSKQKSLVYVVLTNMFYIKTLNNNNCLSFLKNEIEQEQFINLNPVFSHKGELEDLITFEKDSDFYFATKYNCPTWLIHMWRKHFGDQLVCEFLDSIMKFNLQTYVVNKIKTTTDRILLKYPDFSSPIDDVVIYNGTKRYQLTPEYKNDEYIDSKIAYKGIIDLFSDVFNEALIYSGYDDDFVKTAIISTGGKQGLNVAVSDLDKRGELLRFIRVNDLHNINLFEAKDEYSLKAGVSYRQDTVVVFPKSTRFDIVSKYPDYLLHVDRDQFDEIIAGEKKALELCYDYVNEGGQLIYLVNTLNKKESSLIIQEFLTTHPEFILIKDEQLTTAHPFATTLYYAILYRKEIND